MLSLRRLHRADSSTPNPIVATYAGLTPTPAADASDETAYLAAASTVDAGPAASVLSALEGLEGLDELLFVVRTPVHHAHTEAHPGHYSAPRAVSSPVTPMTLRGSEVDAGESLSERLLHHHVSLSHHRHLHGRLVRAQSSPAIDARLLDSVSDEAADVHRHVTRHVDGGRESSDREHAAVLATDSDLGAECLPHSAPGTEAGHSSISAASATPPHDLHIHRPADPSAALHQHVTPRGFVWAPVDPCATFTVAVRGFTARGKDGYECLLDPSVRTLLDAELGPSQHSIVLNHFKALDALAELAATAPDTGASSDSLPPLQPRLLDPRLRPHRVRPDLSQVARVVLPGPPLADEPPVQAAAAAAAAEAAAPSPATQRRFVFAVSPAVDGRITIVGAAPGS